MKKNKQLGGGLGALLTPSKTNSEDFNQTSILLSKIKTNPNQPRKIFEDKSLKQLAQSIDEKGLISPITVKKVENNYVIVAGERRYRAHKLLNKKRILAYVIDASTSKDVMYMALIENIQREDLNPIEEAKGYKYLQENLQTSITDIAKTVGKSRPAVSNSLRLLKLPNEIQESILLGEINAGQARAILQSKTTQGMFQLWKKLLKNKISVRTTEKLVSKSKISSQLQNIQNQLSRSIGERVIIQQNNKTKKGYVKIHFSKKTANRVIEKLKTIKSD